MNRRILIVIWTLAALSACSDKEQTMGGAVRQDTAAFQGTGATPFTAPGWKAGDKVSWEQQLKTRTQNGQNDYTKVN